MKRYVVALALAAAALLRVDAQQAPSKTRAYVEALASARFEGRMTGSNGERLASNYIDTQLRKIGARPLPGRRDDLMPFGFTAGTRDGGSSIGLTWGGHTSTFSSRAEVQALSFSDNGEASGPVVFAGYGLVVPESQDLAYNSYAGLDVKDKIVLVLRYFPEDADQKTRAVLARYSDLRYKAMAARQRGAKGVLVATGPRSPNAGQTISISSDAALAGSGIVAASISATVVNAIFAAAPDKTVSATQKTLDSGDPHAAGFAIPNITITIHAAVERQRQTGHNVVAYLPATMPTAGIDKPWVVLGAHYDHLGSGDRGNSLAGKNEIGRIHAGADDNASGTSAVLAVGETLARQPRRRHVLLALWSGEEIGLVGSGAFLANPPVPVDQVAAYLNFDMVGRMQDNKLTVQAIGTSPAWASLIEQANVPAGFDLQPQQDPYQPTDVASFNQAGIPCLNFFTGTHADYHRPSDTADKIDYADLDRIVDFAASIVRKILELDHAPQFTKVDQPMQSGAGRADLRVYTGTIPDYSTEVKGLLLSGIVGGGPAELAGLQKGDVIVEVADQTIANVYDYTFALELLKIGEPVKVVFLRRGERKETTLTPSARK